MSRYVATANCLLTWQCTFGDNELLDFLQCPVLAVAQRHRDEREAAAQVIRKMAGNASDAAGRCSQRRLRWLQGVMDVTLRRDGKLPSDLAMHLWR